MPLSAYGDRIPQLAFEVMASPKPAVTGAPRLQELARGVCLIPGAGEFAYATTPIRKVRGPGDEVGENVHVQAGRADFDVSLDNLKRDFPAVDAVSLVVAWFGTDLRAATCQIVPKVEDSTKQTTPRDWAVAGLTRATASVVSQSGGRPAYGGSSDDASVIEAIVALKNRGIKVTHNPFVMMDIAAGNALPNPQGGTGQPPYPWRGRITCFPAIGQAGTVDATASATTQINAFFGTATAAHFSVSGGNVIYAGPNEWSYRRFILHQAALCLAAGGVDSFLIGSELIGLTRVRGLGNSFPAVTALIGLAGEVRAMLGPAVKISYGADWTEYGAYSPTGTNDLRFPLDPLWANANINYVGLDWYAPLTDRRDGDPRLDLATLQSGIEGGEGYDFYYASDAARQSKTRQPITDGAYQEPWVWRQKDVRGFWSNAHYERVAGVRATVPTAWVPKSKSVALLEVGFPAVDKGANRPSVFPDPKSVESGLPPFSNGARDDGEQRLALEAVLAYWRDNNPPSTLYAGSMMDIERCHIWAWDARPYPHFPGLTNVWGDGAYAMLGHWLAGRAGRLPLGALVADICVRGGIEGVNVDGISGSIDGFAIETATAPRSVLESLFVAFGLEARSTPKGLVITDTCPPIAQMALDAKDVLKQQATLAIARTSQSQATPSAGRFSAYAAERDYQPASYTMPSTSPDTGPINALALPLTADQGTRAAIANRLARSGGGQSLTASLSPSVIARMEPSDRFVFDDGLVWRADRLEGQWSQQVVATPAANVETSAIVYANETTPALPIILSPPVLLVLDIAAPFTSASTPLPLVGCAAQTWPGDINILVDGKSLGTLSKAVTIATTAHAMPIGAVGRLLTSLLTLKVAFEATLPSTGQAALVQAGQVLDVISWRSASMTGAGQWQLGGVVRGVGGAQTGSAIAEGTTFIVLNDALREMSIDPALVGVSMAWQARPMQDTTISTVQIARFDGIARQPWPPCWVRGKRAGGGIALTWTRRARGTGDGWGVANAPLGASLERYRLKILSGTGSILRTVTINAPNYVYDTASELADFGTVQSLIRVEISQIGDDDLVGRPAVATLTL
jgi:GTA TIM-barrel-like domain/Putative phage tail protein